MLFLLALLSCKKEEQAQANCEDCTFYLKYTLGDTSWIAPSKIDALNIFFVIPEGADKCNFLDTTKSWPINEVYFGRDCQ